MDPRRRRVIAIAAAGLAAVVAIAVGLAVALRGGNGDSAALAAAGCGETSFPSQGQNHVAALPAGFAYNSFPPTSGPHNPQPAIWNLYDREIPQIVLVHNLEHGGVVVQYGDEVPQPAVAQIASWYADDPVGLVVVPLPGLRDRIALTAWTRKASCPSFDASAFDTFRDSYRFQGPERLPPEALQPGV